MKKGPTNQITSIDTLESRNLIVSGVDDTLRSASSGEFTEFALKLNAQPRAARKSEGGATYVATVKSIVQIVNDKVGIGFKA